MNSLDNLVWSYSSKFFFFFSYSKCSRSLSPVNQLEYVSVFKSQQVNLLKFSLKEDKAPRLLRRSPSGAAVHVWTRAEGKATF